jgi:hypothetical protein
MAGVVEQSKAVVLQGRRIDMRAANQPANRFLAYFFAFTAAFCLEMPGASTWVGPAYGGKSKAVERLWINSAVLWALLRKKSSRRKAAEIIDYSRLFESS